MTPERRWRTGRKVGHHVYLQLGPLPADDDPWLGSFRDARDAALAVRAVNELTRSDESKALDKPDRPV